MKCNTKFSNSFNLRKGRMIYFNGSEATVQLSAEVNVVQNILKAAKFGIAIILKNNIPVQPSYISKQDLKLKTCLQSLWRMNTWDYMK